MLLTNLLVQKNLDEIPSLSSKILILQTVLVLSSLF